MEKDFSTFSTEELENMYEQCRVEMSKMMFNPEFVLLCAAIEKELNRRGNA